MEVWHVRHGERCDEVSGAERRGWETSKVFGQGRGYYDSPLTKYGHVQASRAGLYIKSVLPCDREPDGDSSGLSFDRVYTSPLMRAVQTAVCVSQALGNLPLQVVPGLCSCTAALARVGYARVKLLTDADIAAAFPEVNLLPRDPLAPTSFAGAQAWLAARPERRVLAVGHREGTKAMVGSRVPTPHCCIGIFNVDRTEKTYTLRHLLSLAGKPLVSKRSSSAAAAAPSAAGPPPPPPPPQRRGDAPAAGNDDETAETIAAHVIALSNTTRYNGSHDSRRAKPAAKPRRSDPGTDAPGRTTKIAPAASDRTARDRLRWLLLGARAKATPRKPRSSAGVSPTPLATGKPRGGAGGGSPVVVGASGARGINGASGVAYVANGGESGESGASAETRVRAGGRPLPTTRQTGGGDRAADGYSPASSEVAAATHAKAVDAMNGDGTARSRSLPESHCHADDDPAAAAAGTARSNRGAVAREDRGKPLASAVATPARGGCAGRGFRVAALSRRSLSGASSANARRLGVAVDVLSGPMGVLSFLSPFELCAAQAVCKDIAITATGEILWTNLFSLLPGRRRCRIPPRGEAETAEAEGATGSSKALFVKEVSARAAVHASQVAGHVARSKQKSTAIYCLRRSVDKIRMKLSVRLNGKPANLVDTRGSRAQGWASRANLLTEPSSCGGVRRFSLSSSVKVEVPEGLAPSRVLPSMSLAGSWEMAWSPLVPMVRTDRPLLLSQARLLGTDTHGGVALYEVTGLDGSGARKGGGGYSHGGGGGGGGGGAGGGRGGREDGNSVLLPTKRACSLLGVFDDAEWAGQCPSGRVAFLSVHFPHDLLIDAATDRLLMSERPPGVPRFDENVSVFSVALGLRTAGCPLWEKESKNVSARRCSRNGAACLHRRDSGSEGEDRSVMRIDLVRPGENEGKELTLSGDLALPYSTSGGLYGAVEDVLLADFALCDSDGVTVWAFASPIVFEASCEAGGMGTGNSSGGGSDEDDGIIDITYSEVRVERRRGVVVEPGVGRVIVELALVVDFEGSGISGKAAILNRRFPSKHVWVVRVARAELEPNFVTTWMGQDVVE